MTREEAIERLEIIYGTYDVIHEETDGDLGYEAMSALDMAIEALSMQAEMMDDVTLLIKHEGWEDVKRIFLTGEAGLFGRYFYVAEQMEKMEKCDDRKRIDTHHPEI